MCDVDFDDPKGNDWLAVNHVGVVENGHERHSDIVLFNLRGHPDGCLPGSNTGRFRWSLRRTTSAPDCSVGLSVLSFDECPAR